LANRIRNNAVWILLIVAIVHHGVYVSWVSVLNHDKSEMVGAAVSLLEGNGYTYVVANPNQLSEPIFSPLVARPPGYTMLLVPLLWVTDDVWLSTVLLDIVATIVFYVAWYAILNSLGPTISTTAKGFIWMMWALIWSPLVLQSSPELVTLSLFSAAVALTLPFARQQRRPIRFGLFSGVLMGIVGALRLAYWPLLAVVPLALLIAGGRRVSQRMVIGIIVHVLTAGLILTAVLIFQRVTTGQFLHLPVVPGIQRGFYPDQLTTIYPFPTSAVGADISMRLVQSVLGLSDIFTKATLWTISAVMLLAVGYQLIRSFRRRAGNTLSVEYDGVHRCFGILTVTTMLFTLGMLVYMSASYPVPVALREGRLWISISRFYVPILPFLSVYLATVIFPVANLARNKVSAILRVACFVVLMPTIALSVIGRVQFWNATFRDGPQVAYADDDARTTLSSLRRIASLHSDMTTTLVYPAEGVEQVGQNAVGMTDRDGLIANYGRMTGVGTLPANYLPVRGLRAAEGSLLLFYCPREPHTRDGRYLAILRERFEATKIPATDEFDWYTLEIDTAVLQALSDVEKFGLLEIAARRMQAGKLDDALMLYETALSWNPFLLDTHMGIGLVRMRQQRYSAAEMSFIMVVTLKPDYAEGHKQLGIALLRQGRGQEAAASFRLALALSPNDVEVRKLLTEAEQIAPNAAP